MWVGYRLRKSNPYHDAEGRFTSSAGTSGAAAKLELPSGSSLRTYSGVVYHHTDEANVGSILEEGVRESKGSMLGTGTFFSEDKVEKPTAVDGKGVVAVPINAQRVVELRTVFDIVPFMEANGMPLTDTASQMRAAGVQAIRFEKPPTGTAPWLMVFDRSVMGKPTKAF